MSQDVCACVSVWFQEVEIRPPRLVLIPACSPRCRGLRFPTCRAENRGSPSKAVSRAQPAGAAACITTTGFYLVQGGRDVEREVEKSRKSRGLSREEGRES